MREGYSTTLSHSDSRLDKLKEATMQAAVHIPGDPNLKIVNDFEIPKPGPNQVLLQIQASGVCHTDVRPTFPSTMIDICIIDLYCTLAFPVDHDSDR